MKISILHNRGAERFYNIFIDISENISDFQYISLDRIGKREFNKHVKSKYICKIGKAAISWKGVEYREACINYEKKKNRWESVLKYSEKMKNGSFPKNLPVFLHPEFNDKINGIIIDGTRRIMAYLEYGKDNIDVNVICKI